MYVYYACLYTCYETCMISYAFRLFEASLYSVSFSQVGFKRPRGLRNETKCVKSASYENMIMCWLCHIFV